MYHYRATRALLLADTSGFSRETALPAKAGPTKAFIEKP
jgi:hypothetical protein